MAWAPGDGMAWRLVHWAPSHWAQVQCSGRKFIFLESPKCYYIHVTLRTQTLMFMQWT